MDSNLPQQWPALCLLVFALGMRHGFDADHLAAIDGMTRYNSASRPRLARYCGVLFSLGHGGVVVLIALTVSLFSRNLAVPGWLDGFGNAVSITCLLLLGGANLWAVLRTPAAQMVQPVGLRSRWLGGLARAARPGMVALTGALFALSFDTVSQAALFAATAHAYGGWQQALWLGLIFMAGMLLTDGINGLWISRLLRRADQTARIASRLMGLVVAGISLLVAGLALARGWLPAFAAWSEGKEVLFGAIVVLLLMLAFLLSQALARRGPDWSAAKS